MLIFMENKGDMKTIFKGFPIIMLIFAATIVGFNAMGTGRFELFLFSLGIWIITIRVLIGGKKKAVTARK